MKVEDMKGGYTTGSCATAGMKAGLLALLDKNIVDQVVIENPQGQYIEVPIKAIEVISDIEAKVTVMKDGGDDPDVTHGNDVETTVTLDNTGELRFRAGFYCNETGPCYAARRTGYQSRTSGNDENSF